MAHLVFLALLLGLIKKDEKALDHFLMFGILIEREIRAFGWVAQLVEQGTENPRVRGSIPFPATRIVQARGHLLSGLFSYRETSDVLGHMSRDNPTSAHARFLLLRSMCVMYKHAKRHGHGLRVEARQGTTRACAQALRLNEDQGGWSAHP